MKRYAIGETRGIAMKAGDEMKLTSQSSAKQA